MPRSLMVNCRFTPELARAARKQAHRRGIALSTYVREATAMRIAAELSGGKK